jgi:F0F1-type ATP synthase membrane subunit b/b'
MLMEAEFCIRIAFFIFVALLGYMAAHHRILGGFDSQHDRIKSELEEAAAA